MPKKEQNKKSFDLANRWRKRKKESNAQKKQVWVWDVKADGVIIQPWEAIGHWEVKSE